MTMRILPALLFVACCSPVHGQELSTLADVEAAVKAKQIEILDEWREQVGLGRLATMQTVVKSRADNTTKILRFNQLGQAVQRGNGIGQREVRWLDKVAPRLEVMYRASNGKPSLTVTQPFIVWLVDKNRPNPPRSESTYLPPSSLDAKGDRQKRRARYEQIVAASQNSVDELAGHNRALIDRFAESAKLDKQQVVHRFWIAPAVVVKATWSTVQQLAERKDVKYLFADETLMPELDVAAQASLAPPLWSGSYTGYGVRVAVIGESGRIRPLLGALAVEKHLNPMLAFSNHATNVAGVIAANMNIGGTQYKGIAYEAKLYCAAGASSTRTQMLDNAKWAFNEGASILNASVGHPDCFGTLHWSDIVADYIVASSHRLFVTSAGNRGDTDGLTTSPANGYNVLSVGAADDQGDAPWGNDVMYANSSFRNPLTTSEKPEVVAYGTNVLTTHASPPWHVTESGTSLAAPLVSGIAALCVERDPVLHNWPEVTRAKIMVSGLAHDIASGFDKDGAGCAKATAAYTAHYGTTITETDFDPMSHTLTLAHAPQLVKDEEIRIVLSYCLQPNSIFIAPSAPLYTRDDLDLELWFNGTKVAESVTGYHNAFELIDYTPTESGPSEIRIRKTIWESGANPLQIGAAWATKSLLGSSP